MSFRTLRALTNTMTLVGLVMILSGGVLWWRQSRTEAAYLSQEEHVLLAVTAGSNSQQQPPLLPAFEEEDEEESGNPTAVPPTPTSTPSPVPTETPTKGTPTVPRETPTPTTTPTPDPFPPAEEVPQRIIAPSIDLDTSVVEMGWEVRTDRNGNEYSEWVVPREAAGWHVNSNLPGHGGNTVLSGHHNVYAEVFRYVVNLEPGDKVKLVSEEHEYGYVVEEKYIVKEKGEPLEVRQKNNRFIEETPDERLTLVTCWPYETNTHRVIVIARPDLPEGAAGAEDEPSDDKPADAN